MYVSVMCACMGCPNYKWPDNIQCKCGANCRCRCTELKPTPFKTLEEYNTVILNKLED